VTAAGAAAEIAALEVFIDGGVAYLTKETQGLERLALLAALEGSKDLTRDEQRRTLERLGARIGTDINYDYSCVGVSAPRDAFQEAASVLAACLREPELSKEALEQRRVETLNALKKEKENPDAFLRRLANNLFYAGHPCENRPDGTIETVEKFDAETCRKALAEAATASRMVIVVVSPLETAEVQKMITELFAWVKDEKSGPARQAIGPAHPKERSVFEKGQTATTYIRGQFVVPGPSEPGFAAARVLMTILSQRLWEEVRTKLALSYAPSAGIAQTRANFAMMYASSKDAKKTIEVMNAQVARLKEELVQPSDIRNIVNGDITGKAARSETAAAHAISLGRAELLSGGWQRFYDETADLAKVTPEAVRDAARKLLVETRWAFVGPEPVEEKLLGGN
ncbi:MAG: M16 family metallopeptidase, partial [Planctomycetota bacterium]